MKVCALMEFLDTEGDNEKMLHQHSQQKARKGSGRLWGGESLELGC